MTTIQLVKLLLQVWLSSWKFMRDSNSRSFWHLADFTPADLNIQPSPVKGRWLSTEDVAWSQKCSIMVNISFDQTKVETSGTETKKHSPILKFVSSQVLILNQVWKEQGFDVVLSVQSNWEATSARINTSEEQSSGLDNRVICSTMSGCYLYLCGVEYTQQQQKKYRRAGQPRWRQALSQSDSALLNLAVCEISQPASPLWRIGAFRGIKGDERLRI